MGSQPLVDVFAVCDADDVDDQDFVDGLINDSVVPHSNAVIILCPQKFAHAFGAWVIGKSGDGCGDASLLAPGQGCDFLQR